MPLEHVGDELGGPVDSVAKMLDDYQQGLGIESAEHSGCFNQSAERTLHLVEVVLVDDPVDQSGWVHRPLILGVRACSHRT